MGVIISCPDISTPTLYFHRSVYIMPQFIHPHSSSMGLTIPFHDMSSPASYFQSPQYLVRGRLFREVFSSPSIYGEGVIISWHYFFTPDNLSWGGDDIVTSWFRFRQYLVRRCLYRDITFSFLSLTHNLALEVIIVEYFHYPNLTLQWYHRFIIHIHIFTPCNLRLKW